MINVLCYGDSITWGYNPEIMGRFDYKDRWTGILQHTLGDPYRIIESGLNGRTTVFEDVFTPYGKFGVGVNTLPMVLDTHAPVDLVVLMLGTNDLQPHRSADAKMAARGCRKCIEEIIKSMAGKEQKAPRILLMAPPVLKQPRGMMSAIFSHDVAESQQFAAYYQLLAQVHGIEFLDTSQYVESSDVDGVHLDKQGNYALGLAVADKIKSLF
ncbi:MAG: SGNH/GDSL hydrolase family protein [Pseudomonadota bacterium]